MTAPTRWRIYAHGHLMAAFPGSRAATAPEAAAEAWRLLPGYRHETLVVERIEGGKATQTKHQPAKAA